MMGFGVGDGLAGIWIMGLFGLLISVGVIILLVWVVRAVIPANPSGSRLRLIDPLRPLQWRLHVGGQFGTA